MKNLIIILFICTVAVSYGQNKEPIDLGIGFLVSVNPYQYDDGSHYNHFYSEATLNIEWKNRKVFPFFYKPDYGLYHFICLKKTKNYFKILINDSSIAYVPNDSSFQFITWDSLIVGSSLERFSRENKIHNQTSDKSNTIENNCKFERLNVEKVKEYNGEYWAYVSFSTDCKLTYGKGLEKRKYGWIKWRTKKKLLVKILLLC